MSTVKSVNLTNPMLVTYAIIAVIIAFASMLYIGFIADDDPSSYTIETITVPVDCVNNGIGCPINFDRSIIAPEPTPGGHDSGATDGSNIPGASTCDSKYCTITRTVTNK